MELHEFGLRVRKRREELGISQQDIAVALKIDQAKVSLIERGARRVDIVKELPALARVLCCSVNWLCQGDEPDSSTEPVDVLLARYFPDVEFEEFERKRLNQFIEGVLKTYVQTMEPKKASNQ